MVGLVCCVELLGRGDGGELWWGEGCIYGIGGVWILRSGGAWGGREGCTTSKRLRVGILPYSFESAKLTGNSDRSS